MKKKITQIALTEDQWGKVETHINKHNEELGAVQTDMAIVKADIKWLKELFTKLDARIWIILSVTILGFLTTIFFKVW